jgi:hypothetical protein
MSRRLHRHVEAHVRHSQETIPGQCSIGSCEELIRFILSLQGGESGHVLAPRLPQNLPLVACSPRPAGVRFPVLRSIRRLVPTSHTCRAREGGGFQPSTPQTGVALGHDPEGMSRIVR